jgi:glycerophosphoryl diester phosphodiesterase
MMPSHLNSKPRAETLLQCGTLHSMKRLKIIAHRGASGYAPENTLAAFRKAIQMGADMVEFDVHALSSGEVVLMHDHRVNRTTNGKGYVLKHSFADLRLLDAGDKA